MNDPTLLSALKRCAACKVFPMSWDALRFWGYDTRGEFCQSCRAKAAAAEMCKGMTQAHSPLLGETLYISYIPKLHSMEEDQMRRWHIPEADRLEIYLRNSSYLTDGERVWRVRWTPFLKRLEWSVARESSPLLHFLQGRRVQWLTKEIPTSVGELV